ncbi:P-loop NTPase [Proteinivorax tanatarense]|uniref:P-loop NTPase n=1 Tax=Proteinivorax tanatarense TaxID=1260629 RepID=A0AAU7VJZ5_9FIRM
MEVKVLIFAEEMTGQRIFSLLQDDDIRVVGSISDENKVLDKITQTKPDLVFVSSKSINLLLRVCQQIYLLRPRSVPVVITEEYNNDIIQKVMQTGVHYILPMQVDRETLVTQIKSIHANESARFIALENTSNVNWKSKVITVFSSKGGVGCSTVVTNLAIKLAQKRRKVAILDFDMEFGDVAYAMRLDSRNTVAELLQEHSNPNADVIRKYMSVHSSGINVLGAPSSPEYADHISPSQIERIISVLRTYYDYLIIDTSVGFNNVNLSCFDASSLLIYVTGMDLATLRSTKKGLSIVNSLVHNEKIQLLVAKEESSRVKVKDVSQALEFPIWQSIPFDNKLALESINQGRPIVMESPLSKVSKAYQKIANEIDESDADEGRKEGIPGLGIFSRKRKNKKGEA